MLFDLFVVTSDDPTESGGTIISGFEDSSASSDTKELGEQILAPSGGARSIRGAKGEGVAIGLGMFSGSGGGEAAVLSSRYRELSTDTRSLGQGEVERY